MSNLLGGQKTINRNNALVVHNVLVSAEPDALSRQDVEVLREAICAANSGRYTHNLLGIACCTDRKVILNAALEVCRPFIGGTDTLLSS
jgi:hypothetical protein